MAKGDLIIEYFPVEYILLQQEIAFHPGLIEKLQAQPVNEIEIRLLACARYCDIVLDGLYAGEDLIKLAGLLVERLKARRPGRSDLVIVAQLPEELK